MTRFEVAENKILKMKVCMKCNSRNALRATRCRKCSYKNLRMKAKESRSS